MRSIILAALLVSGCASQQMWNLNGQSEAAFRAADTQCWEYANHTYAGADYSANQAAYTVGAAGTSGAVGLAAGLAAISVAGKNSLHEQCVMSRGFTRASKKVSASSTTDPFILEINQAFDEVLDEVSGSNPVLAHDQQTRAQIKLRAWDVLASHDPEIQSRYHHLTLREIVLSIVEDALEGM